MMTVRLTYREMASFMDNAEQDLTVRRACVYDAAGQRLAELRRPLAAEVAVRECGNCTHVQQIGDFGGNVIYVCGHPRNTCAVTVSRTHTCERHDLRREPGDDLEYDIWY